MSRIASVAAAALIAVNSPGIAQVVLDDAFDDGTVSGWLSLGNSLGATHNLTESGGVLASEVIATQNNFNTNRGIVSTTSFAPALATEGFSVTFEVASQGALAPGANGLFLGITSDRSTFFRTAPTSSFGLVFFGHASRTRSEGGVSVVTDDTGNGGAATEGLIIDSHPGTIQLASFQDGFTATISADQLGWAFSVTGVSDPGGAPTTITGNGSWAEAGTDFGSVFDGAADWYVLASNQGDPSNPAHTTVYDRITLELDPSADTDNDGIPDSYEEANGTDVDVDDADLDQDGDGLSNRQEFLGQGANGLETGYGQTRAGAADSDGDSIDDGIELSGAANPWSGGIQGAPPGDPTNPNSPDSDGDGIGDGAEITAGSDPNAPPANTGPTFPFIDRDGDSYHDAAEVAFGSDPDDPGSIPDHRGGVARPNILVIYADDLGFGDMSAYGDLFGTPSPARTPNLDALAAEGVMFTQAHSSNAVCTPSRYALLTGKYNWREFDGITLHYGGTKGGAEVPRPGDVTIAEFLKTHDYDTAAFGKWHLGGAWYTRNGTRINGNPTDPSTVDWERRIGHHAVAQGFDTFRGLAVTINVGPYVYLRDDRVQFWDATLDGGAGAYRDATNSDPFRWFTTSDLNSTVFGGKDSRASLGDPSYTQVGAEPQLISDVEDWFAERASSGDRDPFFAYVSLYSPHLPWAVTPAFQNLVGFDYGDFMREVDDRIGRIISALDDNGFGNDTMMVFSSDNGPENLAMSRSISRARDPNGPLRGNKRDVWDGGTRVPFVVRWPGQAAAGTVSNELIWQGDIFATVAAYLGADLPDVIAPDGESFLNLLRGQRKPEPRRHSVVVSSVRGDLGLKTIDGWKFIDSSGGGNSTSWDSENLSIPNAAGSNRGTPKQLFQQSLDLGEDTNLIADLSDVAMIRSSITELAGIDLLGELDRYRTQTTAQIFPRAADNDADSLPNRYERLHGLDPDWPKDADADLDGDGNSNADERLAGTDPRDPSDFFRIVDVQIRSGAINVKWPTVAGKDYQLWWSSDAKQWNPATTIAGDGLTADAVLDLALVAPADPTRIFLRVSVLP